LPWPDPCGIAVDGFADLKDFRVRQLMDALVSRKTNLVHDFLRKFRADPVNVGQRDNNALRSRDVDASDTCHVYSPSFRLPSGKRYFFHDSGLIKATSSTTPNETAQKDQPRIPLRRSAPIAQVCRELARCLTESAVKCNRCARDSLTGL